MPQDPQSVRAIVALFAHRRQAEAAAKALLEAGYTGAQVAVEGEMVRVREPGLAEARRLLTGSGGRVETALSRAVTTVTGTVPPIEPVEGVFASREVAEAVAERLSGAFPGGEVTIEDERPRVAVLGSAIERRRRVRVRIRRPDADPAR